MTTEAALGLIGGTLGLLTGFSILSGVYITFQILSNSPFFPYLNLFKVEIIYYLLKFFWSLRVSGAVVSSANKIFRNYLTKKD